MGENHMTKSLSCFRHALRGVAVVGAVVASFAAWAAPVPLADYDARVNPHPEHPKAVGSSSRTGGVWTVHYDFSEGGHGVGLVVTPKKPIRARNFLFEAKHGDANQMCVIVTDATGQQFRKVATPVPGVWRKFSASLSSGWINFWGGANDGVLHQPVRAVEITVDRSAKGVKDPKDVGEVFIRNLAYEELGPEAEAADADFGQGVRYLVTDFRPGDVFSAGPRAFFRSDLQAQYDGGEMEIDFAKYREVVLFNEIPIWGSPEEFLLSVEAPAESAGLEFCLACRAGRPGVTFDCGRLRPARKGAARTFQTFSIPGFYGEGWKAGTNALPAAVARSKRLMRLVIRRGKAPAKRLKVRPVRFEAVVRAGTEPPPLVAVPPTGAEAPRTLEVGYLNLGRKACAEGEVRVTASDWTGNVLTKTSAKLPVTRPGERAFAKVPLPPAPQGLNFVSYRCELVERGERNFDIRPWTTSWTRPMPDAGSAEKNPDVPWGFGVYIHRSEDRYAYSSGYASPTNAAALAEMEKRAALAQAAGIKWERAEFKPSQANPARGRYDFTYYDRLFEIADRHGISCLALWSHYFPSYDRHYTQQCYDDYIETLRVAAERYRGRFGGWEIWNEPNISFWTGPKDDYVKLANMAYDVLKAADPSNRVVTCSTAGVPLDYIDHSISIGMKFDDLSIHPYRANPAERRFLADLAAVTNRSRGTGSWLSEMGWPTGCDQSTYTEIQQAAYYARAYMTAAGSGAVHSIYGYNFVDDGFNVLERENNFGILRRDLTPKPAYRAVAKVCRTFMKGRPALEAVRLTEFAEAWIFRMGGKAAVWADAPAQVRIRTASPARVTNLMDEPISDGVTSVSAAVGPLKVVFFDSDVTSVTLSDEAAASGAPETVEF